MSETLDKDKGTGETPETGAQEKKVVLDENTRSKIATLRSRLDAIDGATELPSGDIDKIIKESSEVIQGIMSDDKGLILTKDKQFEAPIIRGTDMGNGKQDRGLKITNFLKKTGYTTLDPGFDSTSSCISAITYVDGKDGILKYRGYPIEQLAEQSTFREVAYLLIFGKLPNKTELEKWSALLSEHSLVREEISDYMKSVKCINVHPMEILSSTMGILHGFYENDKAKLKRDKGKVAEKTFFEIAATLVSKIRTLAALSYRISQGEKFPGTAVELPFCDNFLRMLKHNDVKHYVPEHNSTDFLQKFLILHADHEQNLSTSTVRIVSSGKVNIYSSIASSINALYGPLHGGANEKVIDMLTKMKERNISPKTIIDGVKSQKTEKEIFGDGDEKDEFKIHGFGHRIYKTYDPRAKIMKHCCDKLLQGNKFDDDDKELFEKAQELEHSVVGDNDLTAKGILPNTDFYTGIGLQAIGIPKNMFTVTFAVARTPGWVAHHNEQMDDPENRIARPRQIYNGPSDKQLE